MVMKILILKNTLTTLDNFTLKRFEAGNVYELRESAGCRLIARGEAVLFEGYMKKTPCLIILEPPETEPVTLNEAKKFLRLNSDTENDLVSHLIKTSRQIAEEYLGKSLITQTLQLQFDNYAPPVVNLLRGPVQEIVSVIIVAQDLTEGTLTRLAYYLTAGKRQVVFDAAPMGKMVQVQYIAGYGTAADVPAPIKQGMLEHIVNMYDNRGQNDLPANVRSMYAPYRTMRV